jgi:hypothetical protein
MGDKVAAASSATASRSLVAAARLGCERALHLRTENTAHLQPVVVVALAGELQRVLALVPPSGLMASAADTRSDDAAACCMRSDCVPRKTKRALLLCSGTNSSVDACSRSVIES